jgi:hypothetical protein
MIKSLVIITLSLGLLSSLNGQDKFNWTDTLFTAGQTRTIKLKRAFDGPCTVKPCYDFGTNKATYDTLVNFLKRNKEVSINLVWHTWTEGSSDYNLAISKRMSEGLILELARQGIEKGNIFSIGFGEARPIFSESDLEKITDYKKRSETDRENERVEVIIVSAPNKMYNPWR